MQLKKDETGFQQGHREYNVGLKSFSRTNLSNYIQCS